MIRVYPAIFHEEDEGYWVEFPDLIGCQSSGETIEDAAEMAQEALGLYLASLMEDGSELPKPTDIKDLDLREGHAGYVSSDVDKFRRDTRAIRKTISIPKWMSDEAQKRNISLSKVLQESLIERFGL